MKVLKPELDTARTVATCVHDIRLRATFADTDYPLSIPGAEPVRLPLLAIASLFSLACAAAPETSASAPLSAAALDSVRGVDVAFAAAMNAKDTAAASDMYDGAAFVLMQDAPAMDKPAFLPVMKGLMEAGASDFALNSTTVYGFGDLAYMVGTATYAMDGGSHSIKYVEVVRRGTDGKWRYVVDAFSNIAPPPALAEPVKK